ncbi:hypothetical protein FLA_0433 [Filimonas lacunae]|nr:hypothetical protein FLA_0433 [Filimonas lacunae]
MEVGFLSSKFLLKYDGATLKLEVTGLICSNHNATKFITPLQEGHIPNAVAVDKLLSDTKEIRSRHAILPSSEQATINSNTPPAEQKNKTFKKRL